MRSLKSGLIKVDFSFIESFRGLPHIRHGVVVLMSGRGSGKSISASKCVVNRLLSKPNARGILMRDEATRVRNSILNDVKNIAHQVDDATNGMFSKFYSVQENRIKNVITGEDAVFTIGLKNTNNEQTAKLKSLSNIDFIVIEEAEDIRNESAVKKLMDTLIRFPDALILFILNTPEKEHWIIQKYFGLEKAEYAGYWRPVPKKLNNVHYFLSNFEDNEKLIDAAKEQYREYGNPQSPNYDLHWYCNQILGLVPESSLSRSIVTRFTKDAWRDFDDVPYTIEHGWIRSQLSEKGKFVVSFDGGMHTTHSAAVLHYNVNRYNRDILLKEFWNQSSHEDIREVALQVKEFCVHHDISLEDLEIIGDPALKTYGDHEFIKDILGKYPDMLEQLEKSDDANERLLFQHRKERRLKRLVTDMYQRCSDNQPQIILLKNTTSDPFDFGCPNIYVGLFEGKYRRAEKESMHGKIVVKDLEQIKPITDLCDAYTYTILKKRPFSQSERTQQSFRVLGK